MHHHFIDRYARGDSIVHRLDARTKLVVALVYTGILVSLNRYELAAMGPLVILPFAWICLGRIPWSFVGRHVLLCSPFILTLALFNPLFDSTRQTVSVFGQRFTLAGGWVVAMNLVGKYLLGVTCLIGLSSTTRFDQLLLAMQSFRLPKVLILQLYFLYRYLFELMQQGHEVLRARQSRLVGRLRLGPRMRSSAGMAGVLFIRSYESAMKVYQAMEARLYDGEIRTVQRLSFSRTDAVAGGLVGMYLAIWLIGRGVR